jgi:hypothetical protein
LAFKPNQHVFPIERQISTHLDVRKSATNCADIPIHRADLYRSIVENDSALAVTAGAVDLASICHLAEIMFEEVRYSLRLDEATELLKGFASDPPAVLQVLRKSRPFQEETRRNSSGLTEVGISFSHESFGKYLAARHLKMLFLDSNNKMDARLRELSAANDSKMCLSLSSTS